MRRSAAHTFPIVDVCSDFDPTVMAGGKLSMPGICNCARLDGWFAWLRYI